MTCRLDPILKGTANAELEALLEASRRRTRGDQLVCARLLVELHARRIHRDHVASTFSHYAETRGFGANEAWSLLRMHEAVIRDPGIEEKFLAGEIPLRAAAALPRAIEARERLAAMAETAPPPEDGKPSLAEQVAKIPDPVELATRLPTERFKEWTDDLAAALRPLPASVFRCRLEDEDRRDYRRARRIAMKKAQMGLDEGQALGVISRGYLLHNDPRYRKAIRRRARKGPRPGASLQSRYVPQDVVREVVTRDEGACVIPLCPQDAFLHLGHMDQRHADGGGRTVENLAVECSAHNLAQERGAFEVVLTALGRVFVDRLGFVMEPTRRPSRPRRRLYEYLRALDGECPVPSLNGHDPPLAKGP